MLRLEDKFVVLLPVRVLSLVELFLRVVIRLSGTRRQSIGRIECLDVSKGLILACPGR
ncbi:hypothetical protein GCM10027452_25250 [Micromonospora halotolerans]